MRIALVANPGSGKGTEPEEIAARLRALGSEVELLELGDRVRGGVDRVVVAGGDGSVGLCAAAAGEAGVALAVIPIGTANDFASFHDLPTDLGDACALAVNGARTVARELARMDGRPFVNVASGGLAPVAAQRAKPMKKVLGPGAYVLGAVSAGVTGDPFHCVARVDGRTVFDDEAWQVIVASTGAFGGGAELEETDPADGRLDLVAVPAGSRLGLPGRALAMRRGDLGSQDGVAHADGRTIVLDVEEKTLFNVDGEIVACESGRVEFTVAPAAYRLVLD